MLILNIMAEEKKFEAFNADGEPLEGVLAPEEAKTLQTTLEEVQKKLAGLENKEYNFRRLENMTEEQKGKLTATELALKKQQEELEDKQKAFTEGFVKDIKGDVLSRLVGDDEELKKKVELNFSRLKDSDNAKSRSEIETLMKEAYKLSIDIKAVNPINSAFNASGSAPKKSTTEKLSDDAIAVGKKMGLSDKDLGLSKE